MRWSLICSLTRARCFCQCTYLVSDRREQLSPRTPGDCLWMPLHPASLLSCWRRLCLSGGPSRPVWHTADTGFYLCPWDSPERHSLSETKAQTCLPFTYCTVEAELQMGRDDRTETSYYFSVCLLIYKDNINKMCVFWYNLKTNVTAGPWLSSNTVPSPFFDTVFHSLLCTMHVLFGLNCTFTNHFLHPDLLACLTVVSPFWSKCLLNVL